MATARALSMVALVCACGRTALGDGLDDGLDAGVGDGGADERGDDDPSDDDPSDDDPSNDGANDDGREPECDLDSHEHDCDGDGVPDADDPFPEDPSRPGRASPDLVYLQSSSTLSTLDLRGEATVTPIAEFSFPDDPGGSITDIAIDRFGVLYGVASAVLHACHPVTGECWALGDLGTNSLGFVPIGILDGADDMLVTLAGSTWMIVRQRGPELEVIEVGDVEDPYMSSGDIATTADDLTVFTSGWPRGGDVVVAVDPASAEIVGLIGPAPTPYQIWGVVAYDGGLVLCDQLGGIYGFDPTTTAGWTIGTAPHECWGAAAHPDLR